MNSKKMKMQNVSFKNVDEFLEFLPKNELLIVESLRNLVLSLLPECTEKLSYQVPFYKINKNICFIWPASVYWGKKKSYNGVLFGLTYGINLTDESNYFEKGERKQVTMKKFEKPGDIDFDILKSFIFEAALYDKQFYKKK